MRAFRRFVAEMENPSGLENYGLPYHFHAVRLYVYLRALNCFKCNATAGGRISGRPLIDSQNLCYRLRT